MFVAFLWRSLDQPRVGWIQLHWMGLRKRTNAEESLLDRRSTEPYLGRRAWAPSSQSSWVLGRPSSTCFQQPTSRDSSLRALSAPASSPTKRSRFTEALNFLNTVSLFCKSLWVNHFSESLHLPAPLSREASHPNEELCVLGQETPLWAQNVALHHVPSRNERNSLSPHYTDLYSLVQHHPARWYG